MSSTDSVDFSVRHNKSIERALVFQGLKHIVDAEGLKDLVYVGLGSVWFADFILAHRILGIETMISIEYDEVVYQRAFFNKPYRTVDVEYGDSEVVIPALLKDADLACRPWIVWLDYDKPMDEDRLEELKKLVGTLPKRSVLLTTFSAVSKEYADLADQRRSVLSNLFGDAMPEGVARGEISVTKEKKLMQVLAQAVETTMDSEARKVARVGGYVPAFSLTYKDGTPMVTVGGYLPPDDDSAASIKTLVAQKDWPGRQEQSITVPPLTFKEMAALQAQLPSDVPLTRKLVKDLGFDLRDTHISAFANYYLHYPQYAQIFH